MRSKRIITAAVILGIICSLICAVGVGGVSGFSPRLSAPEYGDFHYYSGNVFYNSGYGMPNCTAYAWGRAYELLGEKPELCTGNAGNWYDYNKATGAYPYGNEPRVGAVACFDNPYGGHVAVVEEIHGDSLILSNSAYGGKSFYLTEENADSPGQSGWTFQGYIYIGNFAGESSSVNSICRVTAPSGLNLRRFPGMTSEILTTIPEGAQLFVTSVYEEGGTKWGRTSFGGTDGYCALEYVENLF